MSRYAILDTVQQLDPEKDHQPIVFLSSCYDFPYDTTRALEFAYFSFWREVGRRMNIKDIPADYTTFEKFNRDYERRHYRATRELFVSWFPRFLSPLVRSAIYSLLDDSLIDAFGFPRPSRFMRTIGPRALRLRGMLAGLLPRRRHPRLRTEMRHASYPEGYVIERLGPPESG